MTNATETTCPTCKGDGCKAERADAPLTLEPPHWMGPAPCDTCHGLGTIVEDVERAKRVVRVKQWPVRISGSAGTMAGFGRVLADRCDELEARLAECNQGGKTGFQTHEVGTQPLSGAGMTGIDEAMSIAKLEVGRVFILTGIDVERHPTRTGKATVLLRFVPGNGVAWIEEYTPKADTLPDVRE